MTESGSTKTGLTKPGSIAVIVPGYNAAGFISTAIQSILSQTRRPDEILVVDDGSKDNTAEVASRFPHPVRVFKKPNGGPASARNLGAREASSEWLCFLDADDIWLPQKLERQITAVRAGVGLIHSLYKEPPGEAVPGVVSFDDLWKRNCIACSTVMIRRDLFLGLGGFDEDRNVVCVEDYHLWLRVAATEWLIVTVQELLIRYTPAPGSLTQQVMRFANAELTSLRKIGAQFRLSERKVKQKELQVLDEYGRELIHCRDLRAARSLLGRALLSEFSLRRLGWWSAAFFPPAAFNLYSGLK